MLPGPDTTESSLQSGKVFQARKQGPDKWNDLPKVTREWQSWDSVLRDINTLASVPCRLTGDHPHRPPPTQRQPAYPSYNLKKQDTNLNFDPWQVYGEIET